MVDGLLAIDPKTKRTPGSGCGNSLGDISNKYFFIECKQKRTKFNLIMDYKDEWLKLNDKLPIDSPKIPLCAYELKSGETFVVMKTEDFFKLSEKAFCL